MIKFQTAMSPILEFAALDLQPTMQLLFGFWEFIAAARPK
jgi:hypothetical protein